MNHASVNGTLRNSNVVRSDFTVGSVSALVICEPKPARAMTMAAMPRMVPKTKSL